MKNKMILFFTSLILSTTLSAQLLVTEEPIVLKTTTGDIYGTLKVPSNKTSIPLAIIIGGSGPTDRNGNQLPAMQNNTLKMLSDGLFYNNIATLCFDKRGIGESKSSMKSEAELRFDDYIEDVKQWIDLLSKDKRFSEIVVIGHSEGSLIGMVACKNNKKTSKYISLAGSGIPAAQILKEQLEERLIGQPQSVKDMIFSYIDKLDKGETISDVPQTLYSLFRPSVQEYMISWFKYNPQTEISQLSIPVMIIQGTTDLQVSIKHAELLTEASPKAKKVIIENMNHVLKDSESQDLQEQISTTYNNPNKPIHKEMIKTISEFIKTK